MNEVRSSRCRIGISGWQYRVWRGTFYPEDLPQRSQLAYVSGKFDTLELNGSFYSLKKPADYLKWREQTGKDFLFAIKGGRFISHMKRLLDVQVPLANFFASGVLGLAAKLGPILWQFPATMKFDERRFSEFLRLLPDTTRKAAQLAKKHDQRVASPWSESVSDQPIRYALEVRNDSFNTPRFFELLRDKDAALVVSDNPGKWPILTHRTASFIYLRFHGSKQLYSSGYSKRELEAWCRYIASEQADGITDAYVYFDNDAKVRAPRDALLLKRLVAKVGAARE